jgi:hypothetical protein
VSARSDTSARICAAEFPPPTTSTRIPANSPGDRYWAACSCRPANSSAPGYVGQNGRDHVPSRTPAPGPGTRPRSSR